MFEPDHSHANSVLTLNPHVGLISYHSPFTYLSHFTTQTELSNIKARTHVLLVIRPYYELKQPRVAIIHKYYILYK